MVIAIEEWVQGVDCVKALRWGRPIGYMITSIISSTYDSVLKSIIAEDSNNSLFIIVDG